METNGQKSKGGRKWPTPVALVVCLFATVGLAALWFFAHRKEVVSPRLVLASCTIEQLLEQLKPVDEFELLMQDEMFVDGDGQPFSGWILTEYEKGIRRLNECEDGVYSGYEITIAKTGELIGLKMYVHGRLTGIKFAKTYTSASMILFENAELSDSLLPGEIIFQGRRVSPGSSGGNIRATFSEE
jgi:hypothetical protein